MNQTTQATLCYKLFKTWQSISDYSNRVVWVVRLILTFELLWPRQRRASWGKPHKTVRKDHLFNVFKPS